MWPKARTLILILSLSLNGAFLAVWLATAVPAWLQQSDRQTAVQSRGDIWSPLHRELEVTPEQWRAIEPVLMTFQKEAQAQRSVITALRSQVIDLLSAPQASQAEIRVKQDEALSAMHRMQDLVISHFLAEKELLSPEQQDRMFEIARRNNSSGCKTLSVEEPKHWFRASMAGR
jgi:Spy/CpxP family protein refolding chaperone